MGSSYFSPSTAIFVVYGPFPASNLIHFVYDECLGFPRLDFPSNFPPTTTFSRVCVACSFFTPTVFRMPRVFRSSHTIHRPGAFIFCPGSLHTPFASNAQKSLFFFFDNILDYRPCNNDIEQSPKVDDGWNISVLSSPFPSPTGHASFAPKIRYEIVYNTQPWNSLLAHREWKRRLTL